MPSRKSNKSSRRKHDKSSYRSLKRKLSFSSKTTTKRKMSSSSSEQKSTAEYPNLYAFVKKNILPNELAKINKVIKLYADLILKKLKHENPDLNLIIYSISPFPGWLDRNEPKAWNGTTPQLEKRNFVEDLRRALEKDGINIGIIESRKFRKQLPTRNIV